MPVAHVEKFKRFFRVAAGLDVDKNDLKRYSEFINAKIADLLIRGQGNAKANRRDIIQPFDLPIPKGLQERMHEFREIDEQIGLKSALDALTRESDQAGTPPLPLLERRRAYRGPRCRAAQICSFGCPPHRRSSFRQRL